MELGGRSTGRTRVILVADDDADDQFLVRTALKGCNPIVHVRTVASGEELLDYLLRRGAFEGASQHPLPDLVLLDLNMPGLGGLHTLREMRALPILRRIPVIVLTTSSAESDVARSYDEGSNAFLTKPLHFDELREAMQRLCHFWIGTALTPPNE